MSAAGSPQAEALGVEIYPGFAAADLCTTRTGASGVAPATWASSATARRAELPAGHGAARQVHADRRGRARLAVKQLIANSAARGREPQKYGIGIKELWEVEAGEPPPGLVQHTFGWPLDNRTGGGSFLYHWRTTSCRRLRRAPELRRTPTSRLRRVPALQDASAIAPLRGRQAHRLWRARHHRGRLAVGAEADLPRRRADRLRGGLRQRAAHQGQPQRHEVRACWRPSTWRGARAGRATTSSRAYEEAWRDSLGRRGSARVRNVKPLWSKLRHRSASGSAARHVDNQLFGVSLFGTLKHGKPDHATLKPADRSTSRSPIPSPTAC
jgi:electron-transferring-flavoprotein dehydrogenase